MKKIIFLSFIILLGVLYLNYEKPKEIEKPQEETNMKAVFVSYIDYADLKSKTKEEQQNIINEMINNIYYFGFNTIILQVRSHADSIYESNYFPSSNKIVKNEGDKLNIDILQYFIEQSNKKNIDIYAWINPYRIRSDNDTSTMDNNSLYYDWLNTNKIQLTEDGIYFNPAEQDVLELIINGVKEIAQKYKVKGILYDDYFYPNEEIDLKNYEEEKDIISIEQYRISTINNLLKQTYNTIKDINKNILFGISPSGNIPNNLNNEYLDIETILKEKYLDFIMPQLYYGFNNETKPYVRTLNEWNKLNINNINLYVALSLYKSGTVDVYAKQGENEWMDNTDIIKKQILISEKTNNYKGYSIFRYEYLFEIFDNNNLLKEIENLRSIMNID